MRMLKPSPGECVDRQTILELKMKHGGAEEAVDTNDEVSTLATEGGDVATVVRRKFKTAGQMNIQPFIDEHTMVQDHLERNWFPSLATNPEAQVAFDKLSDELREVNAEMWRVTDQSHEIVSAKSTLPPAEYHSRAAEFLNDTITLNDRRARLVEKINELFGVNVIEKVFR